MEPAQRVSFIVRLTVEEAKTGRRGAVWDGEIEHVMSQEKGRVDSLGAIGDFIRPHLQRMGVRFGWHSRLRRWLSRLGP